MVSRNSQMFVRLITDLSDVKHRNRVLVTELEDGIIHVQLNRPDKLNSLDLPMFEAIADTATSLRANKSARVVILSGIGKAFCTGLDVKSMGTSLTSSSKLLEKPAGTEHSNLAQDVGYLWRKVQVPVIASLHGMVYGGGLQVALGADFRFATSDCKLSIMEAKWGLIPDMSISVTLRELVRIDVAKELTMTGRIFSATEALNYGIVTRYACFCLIYRFKCEIDVMWIEFLFHRVVADPFAESLALAKEIVTRSPDAIAAAKLLYQDTWVRSEKDCLNLETEMQKKILLSWNQVMASKHLAISTTNRICFSMQISTAGRNFGVSLPYVKPKEFEGSKDE